MQCVYELQKGFSMGALTVLGLQLCLLTFSLGAKVFPVWSVSDTENQEDNSKEQPPNFETGYRELHQAEVSSKPALLAVKKRERKLRGN